MTALVIKNVPEELRLQLKLRAKRNRRSMTSEALVLLENALANELSANFELPAPFVGTFEINDDWLANAKEMGRA